MTKPTKDPYSWATDANYPAGPEPEAGTATKVDPTTELTIGWRPGAKPPAQKMNAWANVSSSWLQWLLAPSRNYSFFNTETAYLGGWDGVGAEFVAGYLESPGGGGTMGLIIDRFRTGEKLIGFRWWAYGDGAKDHTVEIYKQGPTDAARTLVHTEVVTNTPAAWTQYAAVLAGNAFELIDGHVVSFNLTTADTALRVKAVVVADFTTPHS
jgi:hypothetical protein